MYCNFVRECPYSQEIYAEVFRGNGAGVILLILRSLEKHKMYIYLWRENDKANVNRWQLQSLGER